MKLRYPGLLLILFWALGQAAEAPKEPIILRAKDAKMSAGLRRFGTTYFDEPFIGRWLSQKDAIDLEELAIEPGKYRMVVNLIPEGGGYLLVKVGDNLPVRRSLAKVKGESKPQDYKFGEIEISSRATKIRLTADNIVAPGLCQFFHLELTWLGPLPPKTQVKSPSELLLEKQKAVQMVREAQAAAQGAELLASRLKGTAWNWYTTIDFKGGAYPMQFGEDSTIDFSFKKNTPFKILDGKTIDIFYTPEIFWRCRFADDFKSFRADLEAGVREPKSGKRK